MKLKTILPCIGLALLTSITSQAQQAPSQYATTGTAVNSGTNWLVIPAESGLYGTPVLTFLSVNALSTGSPALQQYINTNNPTGACATFNLTNSPGLTTTNFVTSTNGFTPPYWAVIHHQNQPLQVQDEAVYVLSHPATLSTNGAGNISYPLQFQNAPLINPQPGDSLYVYQVKGAAINFSSSTSPATPISGPGILTGQSKQPMLLVIQSGSTAGTNTINAANANFIAP